MRRIGLLAAVLGVAAAQTAPILSRPSAIIPPAIDAMGRRVAFGSATAPDGSVASTADGYIAGSDGTGVRRLTDLAGGGGDGVNAVSLSPDGSRLAYTMRGASEQVHVVDTATGADRTVAVDREGCIQILALCINCVFYCVNTPHVASDGSRIVYAVRRDQPSRIVHGDGTGAA